MKKEVIVGFLGGIGLLLFYFLVMGVSSGSWSATLSQFRQLWYWMIILATGFGIQIGLYTNIKNQILKIKNTNKKLNISKNANLRMASSSTMSGVSMVACCAHHLSDLLPIIGLSGAALFLTKYQIPLIILGILMNAFGIVYMIRTIQKLKISHIPS